MVQHCRATIWPLSCVLLHAGKEDLIIIQSPVKDTVVKNENEQFTVRFPLVLGENIIKVTAYGKDKQTRPQEKDLHIYYLDEQLW